MALSVDYIYQFALRLIRKNQSGSMSPLEFADFWNSEQNAFMADLLGHFQRNSNGKSGINTGLIQNQTIVEKLSTFTEIATPTITSGFITRPIDFVYTLAFTIDGHEVSHINHNQIASVNQSVIDPASVVDNKYYYKQNGGYMYIYPASSSGSVMFTYIRQPLNVVWNYTFDGDGRQVYSPCSKDLTI